jgi:hypothetical protein
MDAEKDEIGSASRPDPKKEPIEQRIERTAQMVVRRLYKGEIKRFLRARYGASARTCENYLARAREMLLTQSGRPKNLHVSDAMGFYESVIRDSTSTFMEKLVAQQSIDRLLGLAAPTTHRLTGADGGSVVIKVIESIVDEHPAAGNPGQLPDQPQAERVPEESGAV